MHAIRQYAHNRRLVLRAPRPRATISELILALTFAKFALSAVVSQSLAGRTGVLELCPPSWGELQRFPSAPQELFEAIWMGAYPRIFDRAIPADQWLADYARSATSCTSVPAGPSQTT